MNLAGNGSAELSEIKASFPGLCTSLSSSHWTQLLGESTVLDNMAVFVREQSSERASTLNCVPQALLTVRGMRVWALKGGFWQLIVQYIHCTRGCLFILLSLFPIQLDK